MGARRAAAVVCALVSFAMPSLARAGTLIDDFESAAAWKAVPADGVEMKLSSEPGSPGSPGSAGSPGSPGAHGRALRVDFRFVKGGGYAVLHRDVVLDLPENYRFTYRLRGECRPNNLEFKLIDSTGANVWWLSRRDVAFPRAWEAQTIKKRHISYAWGPAGGGEIRHVAAIEFAVTAGQGGEGTVWIDDLELTELPPPGGEPPPIRAIATSERPGRLASRAVDGDPETWWASGARDRRPYLELDLGAEREFGGLVIDWVAGRHARTYVIETATEKGAWKTARTVVNGDGGRDWLRLPEREARWLRLRVLRPAVIGEVALREFSIMPLEWGATPESFYAAIAKESPPGSYPRGISGQQPFWTVVGDEADDAEALFSEDGALEVGKRQWSIEPFVAVDGVLRTWHDVTTRQRLAGAPGDTTAGEWPLPVVDWIGDAFELSVRAFAIPDSMSLPPAARAVAGARPRVLLRYGLRNTGPRAQTVKLYVAFRPFQVNPPAQFLNNPGGVASIRDIEYADRVVRVDGARGAMSLEPPTGFGAAAFDQGDIVEHLWSRRLPASRRVHDPEALASGALAYEFMLPAGVEAHVTLVVPLHERPAALPAAAREDAADAAFAAVRERWEAHRRGITIREGAPAAARGGPATGPRAAADSGPSVTLGGATRSLLPQLGYILINRDGAGIQPGSRSYERSWIRDGALTSTALLRLGHPEVAREFIEWFAPYQYADGKVPCCVDYRGSDPVPENDSHGEFVYLVAEYHRYTRDKALVERVWPHVRAAAAYIDSLRQLRRGAEWRTPDQRRFFGLLPPSISHEGYSAKPMHSYWDDLFALRGLKDATYLAEVLGLETERQRFARARDEFQRDLAASVRESMAFHHIDFIPGCADLGDFDATSTTIAFDPVQADDVLPMPALERTFERYWKEVRDRRSGTKDWDAYTPYELRNVGAFVRLGWRDRAAELLEWLLQGQRPPGWRQWPEVVWKDARAPRFLGDLPHTWVGSDYIRSVLDMLAYAREGDRALIIGAGVPWSWTEGEGLEVRALPTPYGKLGYTMRARGDDVEVLLEAGPELPPGGFVVIPPARKPFRTVTIDGRRTPLGTGGEVVIKAPRARIVFRP